MAATTFEQLNEVMSAGDVAAALDKLVERLLAEQKYHELFEARLMAVRHRLGLPVTGDDLDSLDDAMRTKVEEAMLENCKQIGTLLVEAGRYREGWMYLRTAGEREPLASVLQQSTPDEDRMDEFIELALYEGVAPQRGFELVLEHYGTCNAITTFEGAIPQQGREIQDAAATMLVKHLYEELLENVRAHIQQQKGDDAASGGLAELLQQHPWIFEGDGYHVDTSHLASTVRFARLLDDPEVVRLAWELTQYGRRLSQQLQFPGEPPFEDLYPAHARLFAATLGQDVDEALDYFRQQAESTDAETYGTAAIETYLILLDRLGRFDEAIDATAALVPTGMQLSPYAPRMIDLARKAGDYQRYLKICQDRDDVLAYAAGLIAANGPQ